MLGSALVYYSTDLGESWESKLVNKDSPIIKGLNECSIAKVSKDTGGLSDSILMLNCRTSLRKRRQIYLTIKKDSPVPYFAADTYPTGLVDPNCQGSVIGAPWDNAKDFYSYNLFISNDNSGSSRKALTVRESSDMGYSWADGDKVDGFYDLAAGDAQIGTGYSQLVAWMSNYNATDRNLGILFEMGTGVIAFRKWKIGENNASLSRGNGLGTDLGKESSEETSQAIYI